MAGISTISRAVMNRAKDDSIQLFAEGTNLQVHALSGQQCRTPWPGSGRCNVLLCVCPLSQCRDCKIMFAVLLHGGCAVCWGWDRA